VFGGWGVGLLVVGGPFSAPPPQPPPPNPKTPNPQSPIPNEKNLNIIIYLIIKKL